MSFACSRRSSGKPFAGRSIESAGLFFCVGRQVLDVVLGRVLVDKRVDRARALGVGVVDLHEGLSEEPFA